MSEDLARVRTAAYVLAIEVAHLMLQKKQEPETWMLQGLAFNAALAFEAREQRDDTHRQRFIESFTTAWPVVYERLTTGQLVVDATWTEQERLDLFVLYAKQALGLEVRNV